MRDDRKLEQRLQVTINVGRQTDGYVYELDSRSRHELLERFPKLQPVPGVFISNPRGKDPAKLQRSVWAQVAEMLIGLTGAVPRGMEHLSVEVHIFSPKDAKELGAIELPALDRRSSRAAAHG